MFFCLDATIFCYTYVFRLVSSSKLHFSILLRLLKRMPNDSARLFNFCPEYIFIDP